MIGETIEWLGAWTWFIAGILLLILEVLAPGTFFLWFGVAAMATGVVAMIHDFGWQTELILFAILAIAFVIVGRRYFSYDWKRSDQPLLNERAARLIGRDFVLAEPIVGGAGKLRIEDSSWRIAGPDLPSGTRVRVTGHDGALLTVVAAG
ncbi:MAG: NfeD family protein [Rhizobiales bacterium]|nr:NfeD family protein [Hyphomicrobiales bacterium]